ncbi:hypothetical protein RUM43_002192 [Polyplax serrata]|uniref:Uncharacterized protein n=1 Tax=Polyplax serrata TaxID=468196 RepID=A0AAN8NU78_POLSC
MSSGASRLQSGSFCEFSYVGSPLRSSAAFAASAFRFSAHHISFAPSPPCTVSSSSVLGTSTMVQHQSTNSIPLSPYSESSESRNGPSALHIAHQRTKSCPISETSVLGSFTSSPEPLKNSFCPVHRDGISSQSSIDFAHAHIGEGPDLRRSSVSGRRTSAVIKSSTTGTRERSDSMPSRNRTTSEGGHHFTAGILPHSARIPYHGSRPHSMHSRGLSHSPPAASGPCSTDSVGSSVSIDDGEFDLAMSATSPRYGHSSTPDEPAIIEENCNDYCHWAQENGEVDKIDDYVAMERPPQSLSLPIHGSVSQRKVSAPASLKSSSPLHSFMDVCSPCGSSPLETGNYLPMSPGEGGRRMTVGGTSYPSNHSRDSSLAEETVDGYVPMAPNPTDDGYVDMDTLPGHRLHGEDCHHSDMSPGSSCSFTSGTPSTDLRFSEYHLEKVSSYLTLSEEDELSLTERPSRTYSFGSQSETTKSKGKVVEMLNNAEAGRVRAFSVGSKWGKPWNLTKEAHKLPSRSHVLPQNSKSSSAPLLSSSWSGTSRHTQSSNDPMADLMEIDFTENKKKKRGTSSKFRVAPVMESASQLSIDMKSSLHTVTSSADSGYMDMSSKSPSGIFPSSKTQNGSDSYSASPPSVASGSPRTQGFNAIFGKSPPKAFLSGRSPPKLNSHFGRSPPKSSPLAGNFEAVSSKPFFSPTETSRSEPKNIRLTKPAIISSSTLKTIGEKPDVKPQKFPTTSSANLNMYALYNKMHAPGNAIRQSGAYMDMRLGSNDSQQGKDDQNYMEMGGKNTKKFARANSEKDVFTSKDYQNKSLPEGYMEMSCGSKLTRKLSGDNFGSTGLFDDYVPMSGGSQPIAIKGSSMTKPSPTGRTPPKVPTSFLGLGGSGTFSSSRRNGRRKSRKKHERRGSKENVVTPTGSNSTIFPMSLNSPISPKKITGSLTELKEKLTPTNSPDESTETSPADESLHAGLSPNEEDSLYEEMTPGAGLENRCFLDGVGKAAEKDSGDGTKLSEPFNRLLRIFSDGSSNDYVNFTPRVRSTDEDFGDYACMKPGESETSKTPLNVVRSQEDGSTSVRKSEESAMEIPLDAPHGVPYSATANISDSKSDIAQKTKCPETGDDLKVPRLASSQLMQKSVGKMKPQTSSKDNESSLAEEKTEVSHSRLNLSGLDNSRVSNLMSGTEGGCVESGDRKTGLRTSENHAGVTRQVSSSSSSSTEVVSVKEAGPASVMVPGASRPSSTSSEKDITYASLDLGLSGSEGEDSGRSPRTFKTQTSVNESSVYSLISTPTVPSESFNYVKIDFEKSGSLRAPESFTKKIHY